MALYIEIKRADGGLSRMHLSSGTTRISAKVGEAYRVYDDRTGFAPDATLVRKSGNDLLIEPAGTAKMLHGRSAGSAPPSVEIDNFYGDCSAGSPCSVSVQTSAERGAVVVDPGTRSIAALTDGSFVLYDAQRARVGGAGSAGSSTATASAAPPSPDSAGAGMFPDAHDRPADSPGGFPLKYALYGLGGLALIGGVAAAAGGGGGGDGASGAGAGAGAGTSGTAATGTGGPTADPDLKVTSPTTFETRHPTITGTGTPGSTVSVRFDLNGDNAPDVVYATQVDAAGNWAVDLHGSPQSGSLPAAGLPATSSMVVTQQASNGTTQQGPTQTIQVDATAPEAPTIASVATDNVITPAELGSGRIPVRGTAEPGTTVTVTSGSSTVTAVADAKGQWTAELPATAFAGGDGNRQVSVTAVDAGGNRSAAAQANVAVAVGTTVAIAGADDGTLTLPELAAGAGVVVTGTAAAGTPLGTHVQVTMNGTTHDVTTEAGGKWSTVFSQAPTAGRVEASAVIVDANVLGTRSAATANVDTSPRATQMTQDNAINAAEAGSPAGVSISGQAPPGMTSGTVSIAIDGHATGVSGTVTANGTWTAVLPSSAVPAADGNHTVTVTPAIGTVQGQGASSTFVVDRTPPVLGQTTFPNGTLIHAAPTSVERTTGVALTGVTEPGSTVTVAMNGKGYTAQAGANGAWSVTIPAADLPRPGVSNQAVPIGIASSDSHGNSSPVVSTELVVEAAPSRDAAFGESGSPALSAMAAGADVHTAHSAMQGFAEPKTIETLTHSAVGHDPGPAGAQMQSIALTQQVLASQAMSSTQTAVAPQTLHLHELVSVVVGRPAMEALGASDNERLPTSTETVPTTGSATAIAPDHGTGSTDHAPVHRASNGGGGNVDPAHGFGTSQVHEPGPLPFHEVAGDTTAHEIGNHPDLGTNTNTDHGTGVAQASKSGSHELDVLLAPLGSSVNAGVPMATPPEVVPPSVAAMQLTSLLQDEHALQTALAR